MASVPRRAYRRLRRTPIGRALSGGRRPAGPGPPAEPVSPGLVEAFERRQFVGWVQASEGSPPTPVSVYVNDVPVVSTWAINPAGRRGGGELREFRFPITDLWCYTKKTDRVSVRVDGAPLPINQRGMYYHPNNDGEFELDTLTRLLESGSVFSDTGRLQISKTTDIAWQDSVTGLYAELRELLRAEVGTEPFLMYGTLLGAVRDGGFIGHDHDFDTAVVSAQTDPRAAAKELQDIAFLLIDRGYQVSGHYSAIHVFDRQTGRDRVDLFHLYFDERGLLQFPFGVCGTGDIDKADWTGLTEISLAGRPALVPENAEVLAELIYGSSWRTPNPGFSWTRDRTRRASEGLLTAVMIDEIYWSDFYAHTELPGGSTFVELLADRSDLPMSVVDLGCGEGRDSFAFARTGRTVTGVDRSQKAVAVARRKAVELSLDRATTLLTCDIGDAVRLRDVLDQARRSDEPMLFYARFLLHAIDETTQETLLRTIDACARPGDYFAAEFRTDDDEVGTKVHGGHYRRFQNGPAVGALLDSYRFERLLEQEGNGFSPYRSASAEEDPHLYRVVARRAEAVGIGTDQ